MLDLSGVGAGDPGLAFYELLSTLCARLVHVSSMPCSFSDINVTTYHFDLATISHFSLSKDHIQRQRSRVLIPIRCAPRVPSVAVGHRQAELGPLRAASGRSQPLSGTLAHQALAAGAHHLAQARIRAVRHSVAAYRSASRLRSQLGTAGGQASRLGTATSLSAAPRAPAAQPGEVN